ncbi:dephospho-CoA kinase [Agaribacterium haliotis]|uniref:dephospho-CoA kinase n=1 Tax=Agaribacterium haliotis TaxID=2013869 RepID=UPI000BB5351A|nr:dephospho-CoA kinase [Agaribacterium haliotis]
MFKLGLTGGIGSGKSTVSAMFAELGITVVDADIVAREVVEPGQTALAKIAEHFGPQVLLADGSLDRSQLRSLIFADPKAKLWLEQLTHPLIRQEIERQLERAQSTYVILSSPLLLETGQQKLVDRVLVVDLSEAEQLKRACARDQNSEEQIRAIMTSQLSREQRLKHANDVIDNSADKAQCLSQVEILHQEYCKLALT